MGAAKGKEGGPGWAKHFPTGCPPDDATERKAPVFVFIKKAPPQASDFESHRARGLWKPTQGDDAFDAFDACKACGLSVSHSLDDTRKLQALLPYLRKKGIASGVPTPGVVRDTDGPVKDLRHMTWWIPEGATPAGQFRAQGSQ